MVKKNRDPLSRLIAEIGGLQPAVAAGLILALKYFKAATTLHVDPI